MRQVVGLLRERSRLPARTGVQTAPVLRRRIRPHSWRAVQPVHRLYGKVDVTVANDMDSKESKGLIGSVVNLTGTSVGFTLIELLVVIAVIGLLASVILASVG